MVEKQAPLILLVASKFSTLELTAFYEIDTCPYRKNCG